MGTKETPTLESAFGVLRQFARRPRTAERCELCSLEIASQHPHLIEPVARKLVCSCDACALLFSGRAGSRYKRVPRQVRLLANFQMSDAQWDSLMIPINMAFFFHSSPDDASGGHVSQPGGRDRIVAVAGSLERDRSRKIRSWKKWSRTSKRYWSIASVTRAGFTQAEYYLLPIDQCYKLVGLIRSQWRGFSGGMEVWQQMRVSSANLRSKRHDQWRTGQCLTSVFFRQGRGRAVRGGAAIDLQAATHEQPARRNDSYRCSAGSGAD